MAFSIKQTKARSTDGRAKIAHTVKIVKSSSLPQVTQTQQHRVIINLTVYVLEALGPQLHSFDCSWRQQIFKRSFTFVLLSVLPHLRCHFSQPNDLLCSMLLGIYHADAFVCMRKIKTEKKLCGQNIVSFSVDLLSICCLSNSKRHFRSCVGVVVCCCRRPFQ